MNDDSRLQILYTPATLSAGHPAATERDEIAHGKRAGGRLGTEVLAELRSKGWLGGEEWTRGGYFTTSGLREGAGHPELALLNVPGAFAPHGHRLLNEIGTYVLESGALIRSGEVLVLPNEHFAEMAVTFELLEPEALASPPFGREMLLVIPLP